MALDVVFHTQKILDYLLSLMTIISKNIRFDTLILCSYRNWLQESRHFFQFIYPLLLFKKNDHFNLELLQLLVFVRLRNGFHCLVAIYSFYLFIYLYIKVYIFKYSKKVILFIAFKDQTHYTAGRTCKREITMSTSF